ncbi:unnamed protein product [Paramecium sonneborni]|uniref:Uncharacterized protein n=1 Tax=Paramecium sonneborni TaxID=65129 RepID=A0A8S1MWE1_9CILI|nr:unnamed protein product [Paramecium sonneborni]
MKQLLVDDNNLHECLKCKMNFPGKEMLQHEKQCKEQNQNKQYRNNFNQDQEYHALNKNQINNQNFQQQNINMQNSNYQNPNSNFSIRCEFCDQNIPYLQHTQHLQMCEAKAETDKIKQAELPFLIQCDKQKEDDKKIIEILSQYFQIIEQYGYILQKGDELVKAANLSIEPFTKVFQQKICRFCQQSFKLDEEIVIMKCCMYQYHQKCFAQNIINKSKNCECGKQIID